MKRIRNGRAVGPNDLPVEVWKGLWKGLRLVQDMCESSMTEVRCSVGVTDGLKVEVGMQGGVGREKCQE